MQTWDEIRQWRKAQRAELIARRTAAPVEERRRWSDAITRMLVDEFPLLQWMTIGFYWPIQGEFDPRFAMREFRRHGAKAALPVVIQKGAPLQFREWWPGVAVTSGVFGLPVPEGSGTLRPQAVLVPPVGFDRQGYRLGYGGGYFDRTLAAATPQPLKIGVGYDLSRVTTIYPQPHDVPMDFLVTEAGIHRAAAGGLERITEPGEAAELAEDIMREREQACGGGEPAGAQDYASPACYLHEFDKK